MHDCPERCLNEVSLITMRAWHFCRVKAQRLGQGLAMSIRAILNKAVHSAAGLPVTLRAVLQTNADSGAAKALPHM